MNHCGYAIEQVLPHAGPMILLDEIRAFDEEGVEARVRIRPDSRFMRPEGMPAHVIIEYMAQACSAFSGIEALESGGSPRIGYLLGTRAFRANRVWMDEGQRLTITARLIFRDDGMAVFDCRAESEDSEIALAQLTVYQPTGGEASTVDND